MVHQANELAQKIRKARFKAGSLELDFPEMKIRLDEAGRVARIEKIENDISHQLIEEYMLMANEAVAGRLMQVQKPTVYRVHEAPEESRLQEYREEVLSHNVPCGNLRQRTEIQRLLHKLNTLPIGPALKIGFLKSLMRARYALEPLGHFGLAKKKYAHFTSPIRRYADLVVHRSLFEAHPISASALLPIAEHISITERTSADAERDSKDVKRFAYLKAQLTSGSPAVYPALVTEVRNFGFFVDVPDLAMSGVVPLSTVEDDFFVYDAARNHLLGRRTRRIIRLGDPVNVQVAKVDTFKKQVDFRLAGKMAPKGKAHPAPASRPGRPETAQRPSRPAPGRNGPPAGPKLHPAGRTPAKSHSNQPSGGQHRGVPNPRRDGAATASVDRSKGHRDGPAPRGGKPAPTPAKPAPHSGKTQRPCQPHPQHSRSSGSANRSGQPSVPSKAATGRPNAPQKPAAPRPTSTTASTRPVIPTRQAIIPTQRPTALTAARPIIPSALGRTTPTRTWRRE
jgi:ribonuclease R